MNKLLVAEDVKLENEVIKKREELAMLKGQYSKLEQEIVAKRTEFAAYIADREKTVRQGFEQIATDKKLVETQRQEFKVELDAHLKAKAALVQEKIDFERLKSATDGRHRMINDFIAVVRRAYNVLPDA